MDPSWTSTFFCFPPKGEGKKKIAAFDLDWTLIKPKSNKKFPVSKDDWEMMFGSKVVDKLKELHSKDYRIVVFTNQSGLEKHKILIGDLVEKTSAVTKLIAVPIYVYIAGGSDHYRKPSTEMWHVFCRDNGEEIDYGASFYVGDAAGRKKDFGCSDRKFASNIGLQFYTPEEFFLRQPSEPFSWNSFNPKTAVSINGTFDVKKGKEPEMVVLVGMPASGKSTFAKRFFLNAGYVHINRDTLKTPQKCLKTTEEALKGGKSVVIDNTNSNKKSRFEYIKLAQKYAVPVKCYIMQTSKEISVHLNAVRNNLTEGRINVPPVAYGVYAKNFEEPDKSEGFIEITKVNFEPWFENETHKTFFLQWT